jgi:hypothetical protein
VRLALNPEGCESKEMKRKSFFTWRDALLLPWIFYWLLRGILGHGHGLFFFALAMLCSAIWLVGFIAILLKKNDSN